MACLTGARVSTELVLSAKPFHRYKKVLVPDRHSPPWGRKGKVEVKKIWRPGLGRQYLSVKCF